MVNFKIVFYLRFPNLFPSELIPFKTDTNLESNIDSNRFILFQ